MAKISKDCEAIRINKEGYCHRGGKNNKGEVVHAGLLQRPATALATSPFAGKPHFHIYLAYLFHFSLLSSNPCWSGLESLRCVRLTRMSGVYLSHKNLSLCERINNMIFFTAPFPPSLSLYLFAPPMICDCK